MRRRTTPIGAAQCCLRVAQSLLVALQPGLAGGEQLFRAVDRLHAVVQTGDSAFCELVRLPGPVYVQGAFAPVGELLALVGRALTPADGGVTLSRGTVAAFGCGLCRTGRTVTVRSVPGLPTPAGC